MKEQFVTYEIALKLKEKGFDEPCLANYYVTEKELIPYRGYPDEGDEDTHFSVCSNSEATDVWVTAPLWQQVTDWLREKHNLDIMVRQINKDGKAYYKITKIETEDKIKGYSNFCDTTTIARQTAIEKAITLI